MSDEDNSEDLIDLFLNDELDDDGKERLASLMENDTRIKRQFVESLSWDTEIWSALNDDPTTESVSLAQTVRLAPSRQNTSPSRGRSASVMLVITAGLFIAIGLYQIFDRTNNNLSMPNDLQSQQAPLSVARVTGLNGGLIWTGDRGQIVRNIKVGTELAGGTIEGLAPDSWFELQFHDESTVMIAGSSLLTFGDDGQKILRLREGRLSANVSPQPPKKPMVINTRSAVLYVIGTQFDLEANLVSTDLRVNKGAVRFKRSSDGEEVVVNAHHQVTTDQDTTLRPMKIPNATYNWKSQLNGQSGNYGKWKPSTKGNSASLKAIPLVPPGTEVVLFLAGISVSRSGGSPVVVLPDAKFVLRGKLREETRVYFGIRVKHSNGEYAGMFRGDLNQLQPVSKTDEEGRFEAVYHLNQFVIDPIVLKTLMENAPSPAGLVLDGIWAFTHTNSPSGLEIFDVELLPPDN